MFFPSLSALQSIDIMPGSLPCFGLLLDGTFLCGFSSYLSFPPCVNLSTVGGNAEWCSCYGKVWSLLKNLKIKLAYNSAVWLLGIYPKELKSESQGVISTSTFSVIHNSQDVETASLSNDRWVNEENVMCVYNVMLFILTKEGNSTICVVMMNFKGVMLSQLQKDEYCIIPLLWDIWNSDSNRIIDQNDSFGGYREWEMGVY